MRSPGSYQLRLYSPICSVAGFLCRPLISLLLHFLKDFVTLPSFLPEAHGLLDRVRHGSVEHDRASGRAEPPGGTGSRGVRSVVMCKPQWRLRATQSL